MPTGPFFHWNDGTIWNTGPVYFGNRSGTFAMLAMATIAVIMCGAVALFF